MFMKAEQSCRRPAVTPFSCCNSSPSEDIGTCVNIHSLIFLFVWCLPTKVLVHHLGSSTLIAGGPGAVGRKPHSPDELITYEPVSTNFLLASFLHILIKVFFHVVKIHFKLSLFRGAIFSSLLSQQTILQTMSPH